MRTQILPSTNREVKHCCGPKPSEYPRRCSSSPGGQTLCRMRSRRRRCSGPGAGGRSSCARSRRTSPPTWLRGPGSDGAKAAKAGWANAGGALPECHGADDLVAETASFRREAVAASQGDYRRLAQSAQGWYPRAPITFIFSSSDRSKGKPLAVFFPAVVLRFSRPLSLHFL